ARRTNPDQDIRRKIVERLNAIAGEMLVEAGERLRARAVRVWLKLSANPLRLIPLHNSVLDLLSQTHPDMVPPHLSGDSWAYDFDSNTFAVLPPDVHQPLVRYSHLVSQDDSDDDTILLLWRL